MQQEIIFLALKKLQNFYFNKNMIQIVFSNVERL